MRIHLAGLATLVATVALPAVAFAADHDNNVEWNGLGHIWWLDRRPLCPVGGESFTVLFQTYHFDITSARVYVNAGSPQWVNAAFYENRGPYDVWAATIPSSNPTGSLQYYIEVTDGSDTDYIGPNGVSDGPPAGGWVLNFATLSHAPVGATLTSNGGAVFKVWAPAPTWFPQGNWISVRGGFNGWGCTPMNNLGGGWYSGLAANVQDNDPYKFYFWDSACGGNGWDYHEDARYRYVDRNNYSNSVVVNPDAYVWAMEHFDPPPFEEMVIYELHVGTFSGRNDGLNRMGRYRDIVDTHLDHLLYLGVNVVELMPVTEFDGYESWGYNPVNCFAPEEAYGTPEDLKYTIDKLHQAGIAVVLDVVYNHFSSGGNYLWDYGDTAYFDRDPDGSPGCDTPWGAQAALWKQEVQDYYVDNVLYWMEEFKVDGFRLDATRYMRAGSGNSGCYAQGADLIKRINDEIDRRKLQAICIAEELPDSTWITDPTPAGGGCDAQWFDGYIDRVRAQIIAAGLGDPNMGEVANAINAWGYDNRKLVMYVESHDEAGGDGNGDEDRRLGWSLDESNPYSYWAQGRAKLVQGMTIVAPGIPMFLMAGEWLEETKFGAGWNNRIDWSKAVSRPHLTLFFRDVIGLRKSNCALRADAPSNVYHVNDAGNVIAFSRGAGGEIVVVANFSNTNYDGGSAYTLNFPYGGTWYEILNSQASVYGGNGLGNGGSVYASGPSNTASIVLPQMGLLIFRHEDPSGRSTDLDYDGDTDLADFALLQRAAGDRGCGLAADISENGRVDEQDLFVWMGAATGPD